MFIIVQNIDENWVKYNQLIQSDESGKQLIWIQILKAKEFN